MKEPEDLKPTKTYLAQYYHDGGWWTISLQAYDEKDAIARCKKLGLQYDGESIGSVRHKWMAQLACDIGNFISLIKNMLKYK